MPIGVRGTLGPQWGDKPAMGPMPELSGIGALDRPDPPFGFQPAVCVDPCAPATQLPRVMTKARGGISGDKTEGRLRGILISPFGFQPAPPYFLNKK